MGWMTAMAGGAGGAAGGAAGGMGGAGGMSSLAQFLPMMGAMAGGGQQQGQGMPPSAGIVQPNYTMRGSLPSYQNAQAGGQGQSIQQLFASMFPQFVQGGSGAGGPQYGRHTPDWRNNWQMDANGFGVPVPAGTPANSPVPATPTTPAGGQNPQQPPGQQLTQAQLDELNRAFAYQGFGEGGYQ